MSDAQDRHGWMDDGLCTRPGVDPDIWFDKKRRRLAVAMCNLCPASMECGQRAEDVNAYRGVWGATIYQPNNPGVSSTADYLPDVPRRPRTPGAPGDGRQWPGYSRRFCPVCAKPVGTHREPVNDDRGEVVVYHDHSDKSGATCEMAGKPAAIQAVAFTGAGMGAA